MLASTPASILNQKFSRAGIPKRFNLIRSGLSYDLPALLSEDGVPPTRCQLAGGGRGWVGIMLAVEGRARV
jgi:hypothetical protein